MKTRLRIVSILTLLIFLPSAYAHSYSSSKVTACKKTTNPTTCLFHLIRQRFLLIKNVAAYKYLHAGSVYAPKQEMKVLAHAANEANRHQLNVYDLQAFILVQMDISKLIETYWIAHWEKQTIKPKAQKSLAQLRQELAAIDKQLLASVQLSVPILHNPAYSKDLKHQIQHVLSLPGIPSSPNYPLILLTTLRHIQKLTPKGDK